MIAASHRLATRRSGWRSSASCSTLRRDGTAEPLAGEALSHAQAANAELRELAHGILPAALTHGGLPAAIDAIVTRIDLPVDVDLPAARLPSQIEASAYFIVAEALTNAVKYANASRAAVMVTVEDECYASRSATTVWEVRIPEVTGLSVSTTG